MPKVEGANPFDRSNKHAGRTVRENRKPRPFDPTPADYAEILSFIENNGFRDDTNDSYHVVRIPPGFLGPLAPWKVADQIMITCKQCVAEKRERATHQDEIDDACPKCGTKFFARIARCPKCSGDTIEVWSACGHPVNGDEKRRHAGYKHVLFDPQPDTPAYHAHLVFRGSRETANGRVFSREAIRHLRLAAGGPWDVVAKGSTRSIATVLKDYTPTGTCSDDTVRNYASGKSKPPADLRVERLAHGQYRVLRRHTT